MAGEKIERKGDLVYIKGEFDDWAEESPEEKIISGLACLCELYPEKDFQVIPTNYSKASGVLTNFLIIG